MPSEDITGSLRTWYDAITPAAGIEDLREKREQILKQIQDEENEKAKIQQELAALTQRLARINGQSIMLTHTSLQHSLSSTAGMDAGETALQLQLRLVCSAVAAMLNVGRLCDGQLHGRQQKH